MSAFQGKPQKLNRNYDKIESNIQLIRLSERIYLNVSEIISRVEIGIYGGNTDFDCI